MLLEPAVPAGVDMRRHAHRIATLCSHTLNLGQPDYMVVLADERGRVVHRGGNHAIMSTSDSGGFSDGADMVSRGTNGLRLAIVADRPVQLYGAEHWLTSEARFTCTAIPIRDPDFARTVAVIKHHRTMAYRARP